MDLFVVNRYNGEIPNKTNEDEEKNLKKVLKKIEKRKKQRSLEAESTPKVKKSQELKEYLKKTLYKSNPPKEEQILPILKPSKEETEVLKPPEETDVLQSPAEPKEKKVKPINVEGFTILGSEKFANKQKAVRVLPKWLRTPSLVSMDLTQNVKLSNVKELHSDLKVRLRKNSIKNLFPIQAEFIPWQMSSSKYSDLLIPQDVCVSAPTGSGKTLAFTVPVIQYLTRKLEQRCITSKVIRVLVVLPTQSLAQQIFKTFKSYCVGTSLDTGIATGEKSFQDEQKLLVASNSVWGTVSRVDILVCTAGRLVDHIKMTNGFDLRNLEYLIIDEADRVLDTVQDDWLHHLQVHMRDVQHSINILNLLSIKSRKGRPQKLLFSATLSQDPEKLQKLSLFQPKLFTCITEDAVQNAPKNDYKFVGKYTTPSELTEKYAICTSDIKPLVIYKLINDIVATTSKSPRILVFTNSANNAHRLKLLLASMSHNRLSVDEISSSSTSLEERDARMTSFRNGTVNILICTDYMTRGIDFPNVDCVISYNAPAYLKTYIHRAGRTARAGCQGLTITMLQPDQKLWFLKLLKAASKDHLEQIQVANEDLEPLIVLYKNALEELKTQVSNETMEDIKMIKKRKNPNAASSKTIKKRKFAKNR